MSMFIHNVGGLARTAVARAGVLLSGLRTAIREARELEARLSGDGFPLTGC